MLSQELTAPEGWAWGGRAGNVISLAITIPHDKPFSKSFDPWRDSMESFFSWLEENDLKAISYDRNSFTIQVDKQPDILRYAFPASYSFEVHRVEDWPYAEQDAIVNTEFNCGMCGNPEKKISSLFCHNEDCDALFFCLCCNRYRDAAHFDITAAITHCSNCGVVCECGRCHSGYMSKCSVCQPVYQCGHCEGYSAEEPIPVADGAETLVCNYCYTTYCVECSNYTGLETGEERICERCTFLGKDGDKEIFDESDAMAATKLTLPTIPGREMIRLSGVEIEGGLGKVRRDPIHGFDGPNALARSLYDNQLSGTYKQEGYHHGKGFARVETDASCDWECVIGPINMADYEDVKKLNNVVKLIKEHIKSDLLKLDLRCGTHIHIGADRVALSQAYNLHLIYTYIEDVLYRLGAANWPVHRILVEDEEHSAARSPKELTKTKFARTFHQNRYYGLSFSNYFERMLSDCMCGARTYGAFEECTCELYKCTFEFRLFNSTANAIKLHAYLALCQALVAKAISMPEIKDASTFEEFPFVTKRYRDLSAGNQNEMLTKWEERLRYIANDLPLTRDEKKSIYYCIKNSELVKVNGMKELFTGMEASN